MGILWQDLRYGFRMLFKHPGFTAVAILALALGIGANTAIFSVVNTVLLRPLPFKDPDRLMIVWETNLRGSYSRSGLSYPDFADLKAQNHVFERMAAYDTRDFSLTGGDNPAHLEGAVVSADLFPLLGVSASLGRTFLAEEEKPGAQGRAVVLSNTFWLRHFNADPKVLGQSIMLDGRSFNIVGVMPAGFNFPIQAKPVDLWASIAIDGETTGGSQPLMTDRGSRYLDVIARLKPNISVRQAQAEMDSIASSLAKQYPDTNPSVGVRVTPGFEELVGEIRPALLVLLAAVGCVLLIACVNVANLLLARATARHKEMAIRAALGASRFRVIRQLLTESILLSSLGGALGLLLALWGIDSLIKLGPQEVPRLAETTLDGHVLLFTALVSLLTGTAFGLAPALQVSRSDVTGSLKEGGRSLTEGVGRNRVRGALVVTEVALALILLVSAGLLIQSFLRLQRVSPGFDPRHVLTLKLSLPDVSYSPTQQIIFYRQLLSRIEALPRVEAASAVSPLPLGGDHEGVSLDIEGRSFAKGERPHPEYYTVGPDYFRTMGIPLLKGRGFTERDDLASLPVIIINEALARKYFPGEDPVGKRINSGRTIGDSKPSMREIVGVAGDVRHKNLRDEPGPEVYVPHAQVPADSMTLVVRTRTDPQSTASAVRHEVHELDKDLPVYDVKTLDQYVATSVAQPRFSTLLLSIFAAVALVLTAVGLYGVLAYTVAQRTHEIGIRMALGAQAGDVLRLIVGRGMMLALVGIGTGMAGALAVTRLLASLLYGVSATDPVTFLSVALLLSVVAFLACYIPARRATKVDPVVALRYE